MEFDAALRRATDVLRSRGRASRRALRRDLAVDEALVDDVCAELVDVLRLATAEGDVLIWNEAAGKAAAAPRPEGERRQLTVMFCDLAGSTALSSQLDPEELRDVLQGYQRIAAEAIENQEGHIAQYLGDGVLAYFGWPRAHEDDAERAVRAGLRIVAGLAHFRAGLTVPGGAGVAVRVGIHTGPVVVGEVGAGATRETLALGETPNIGARVESVAELDSVCLSDATEALVRGTFVLEDRGAFDLKGVAHPVRVFRALHERVGRGRFEAASGRGLGPLVDRHEARAAIEAAVAAAAGGERTGLLLRGEPGIGKSRLVHHAKDRVVGRDGIVVEAQCSPLAANTALLPVAHALRSLWGDADADALAAIEGMVARCPALKASEAVPLLAELAGVPCPAERQTALADWTPQRRRAASFAAVGSIVGALARERPLLFVIEDLHWADPSTLELLRLLVEHEASRGVVFLLTARPEFGEPLAGVATTDLGPLAGDDVAELVRSVAGLPATPPALAGWVARRTDGVPLFVEELTRAVVGRELLAADASGAMRFVEPGSVDVPDTLYGLLMSRLDRTGPARHLAQVAAVIGQRFEQSLLQAVCDLDAAALRAQLDALVDAQLLLPAGEGAWAFHHALTRDVAAKALLRKSYRALNARVARALLERFGAQAEAEPERVAHHFTEAGEPGEAIQWWQKAGLQALQRSAHSESIAHFTRALELLKELPDDPQRAALELVLRTLLAVPLTLTRGWAAPEVAAQYERAQQLCDVVGGAPQMLPMRVGLQTYHIVGGRFEFARAMAERTLAIAQHSGDAGLVLEAEHDCGTTAFYLGRFDEALGHLARVEALYVPEQHHAHVYLYGKDPYAVALVHQAMGQVCLGRMDLALAIAERAVEHTRRWMHPFSHLWALIGVAIVRAVRYEPVLAGDVAQAIAAQAEAQGFPNWLAQALTYLGLSAATQGRFDEGIGQLRQGLQIWRMTGAELGLPVFGSFLTRALLAADRLDEAWEQAQQVLAQIERTGEAWTEPEALRLCGEIALRREDDAAAEPWLRRALQRAQALSALTWELAAATPLAALLHRRGATDEARRVLRAPLESLREGLDTPHAVAARAALAALDR